MAYNTETKTYDLTKWPSPLSGDLMNEGEQYTEYNSIIFELLRPALDKGSLKGILTGNNMGYPSSIIQQTYRHVLYAYKNSFKVYLNSVLLLVNVHYTYNYAARRVKIKNLEDVDSLGQIGILHVEYVPDNANLLYNTITRNDKTGYGIVIKRNPSQYIYETINILRSSVDSAWKFLKKTVPLWIGGSENQSIGSNNLIKYVTPISYTHLNELIDELLSLNDYINLKFNSSASSTIPDKFENYNIMDTNNIQRLMILLNDIESQFKIILQYESNHQYLDLE